MRLLTEVTPPEESKTPTRIDFGFTLRESFPELERRLKKRYLTALLASRQWPGQKAVADASGLSAPTIRAWCAEFQLKVPGEV